MNLTTDKDFQPTLPQDVNTDENLESGYTPTLGHRLLDRYEIFGIREGGFGKVLLVEDLETYQNYAVKTCKSNILDFSDAEKFLKEVELWVNLDLHPNIVKAHFVEVIEDRAHVFVEYVNGGSLRDRLGASKLDIQQAIDFAYQLCLGMEFANRNKEIAHLDLKPENLLITQDDTLKITDFGLAHPVTLVEGKFRNVSSGTWPYASPEQFTGEATSSQSDIYAFGIIFYEMLTGRFPYPFELARDSEEMWLQLKAFHETSGARQLGGAIYHGETPHNIIGYDARSILCDCIQHNPGSRQRDFTVIRVAMERAFDLFLSGKSPDDVLVADDDMYQKAKNLYSIGKYSDASTIFNQLLTKQPTNAQLWLDAACNLAKMGQKGAAYYSLTQALGLDSSLTVPTELKDF
jgi:serine/threonine protein kinase